MTWLSLRFRRFFVYGRLCRILKSRDIIDKIGFSRIQKVVLLCGVKQEKTEGSICK